MMALRSIEPRCSEIKELATQTIPKLRGHAKEVFEIAGEKTEYQKFCKIQDYATSLTGSRTAAPRTTFILFLIVLIVGFKTSPLIPLTR
jgi:hypothetical protein